MKHLKKYITFALLGFVLFATAFAIYRQIQAPTTASNTIDATVSGRGKVVEALYFHRTARCYTCNLMEKYIREVIAENFQDAEKKGSFSFQSIDVQQDANQHYIGRYQLTSISLFLSLKEDGKELKFENIERIWQLAGEEARFKDYIRTEFKRYLEM